jgi:hypothetical protein
MTLPARWEGNSILPGVVLGAIVAVALPSLWLLRSRGSKPQGSTREDKNASSTLSTHPLPVAPAGILKCVRELSGPNSYSFCYDMANAADSFIYRLRLPLPGIATIVVGDPFAQRAILLGT